MDWDTSKSTAFYAPSIIMINQLVIFEFDIGTVLNVSYLEVFINTIIVVCYISFIIFAIAIALILFRTVSC